jgi:hypothetical protein
MKMSRQQKIALSKAHAIAVLTDSGKILPTADHSRIPAITLAVLLGITYEGGAPLAKASADGALLHWHQTGFKVYQGNPESASSKARAVKDARLIKTAIAETMAHRRLPKKYASTAA